ncbi:MAG: MarR family transcriptional regulator [Novosphingobium sp.]
MPNEPSFANETTFIDEVASLLISVGMAPIEARINGLLFVSAKPLTLDRIAAALNISKSSASVAARVLERHGVVRRYTEGGSKRLRYGISERNFGFLFDQVAFLGSLGDLLRKRAMVSDGDEIAVRLENLGGFFERVSDALEAALRTV